MSKSKGYRDLIVYQKAFALAMKIFNISKKFPKEETYSLADQIRRSSRSHYTRGRARIGISRRRNRANIE
jgi:four helix bundle protein